ncbi:uncharacterized protein B0H18DRAFT_1217205 [Fomitopsis serialis]|uniref:uncharacterized protein n=1 Tax=Fomitopsis serialis TaxID=139415 RepID=UPI0020078F3E|nr:uncharacterized protein B0H18DRAFT_1217205 [Neoantrodia serialis]KAH9912221.1 hypothetical protein B0H18DRAFT_1217205 [Neoantrodia serialis]
MPSLAHIPLPLTNGPPPGFEWDQHSISELSTTTAFDAGIDRRDTVLGPEVWKDFRRRRWIPRQAKRHPEHEPRNGLLMCPNDCAFFNNYLFFICYIPNIRKFILVNYSDNPDLRLFHGKALGLDVRDRHAPFACLFILQEMRVRGHHPFAPVDPDIPADIIWQDWILSEDILRSPSDVAGFFRRDRPDTADLDRNPTLLAQLPPRPLTVDGGAPPRTGHSMALNQDVIAEILAATRASPSWRACVMEGTSWDGTAEDNIQKYIASVDVQEDHDGA